MKKQIKSLLIALGLSIVAAGATAYLCYLDSAFFTGKTVISVLLTVWVFFLVPSFVFAIEKAKRYFNDADPAHSFRVGFVWGDLIILFLVIIAPISGVLWYFEEINSSVKLYKYRKKTDLYDIFSDKKDKK